MTTGLFSGVLPVEGGVSITAPNRPPTFVAERLARVFGTEEDPVNCSWFFKVGACRNGDNCYKKHNAPTSSETLLLSGLYNCTPEGIAIANEQPWTDEMYDIAQKHLESFYEDVFMTLAEYGELEEVVILDNTTRNLIGNVYAKFYHEEDARRALRGLTGRFYDGRLVVAEFTPVADFREARCRAHHEKRCPRPGVCGFMHIKHIPRAIKRRIVRLMYEHHPEFLDRTGKPMSREDYLRARQEEEERRYRQLYPQEEEDIDGVPWSPDSDEDIPDDVMEFYEAALRRERDGDEDDYVEDEVQEGEDCLNEKPWSPSGDAQEGGKRRRKRDDDCEQEEVQDEDLDGKAWSPAEGAQETGVRRRRRRRRAEEMDEDHRAFREERHDGHRTFHEEPNDESHRRHRDGRNEGYRTFCEDQENSKDGRGTLRDDREDRSDGQRTFREGPNGGRRRFREDPHVSRPFQEDSEPLQENECKHYAPNEDGPRRRRRRHNSQLPIEDVGVDRVERTQKLHSSGRVDSPIVNNDDV